MTSKQKVINFENVEIGRFFQLEDSFVNQGDIYLKTENLGLTLTMNLSYKKTINLSYNSICFIFGSTANIKLCEVKKGTKVIIKKINFK